MNGMLKLLEGSHATNNWIEWGQKQSQKTLLSLETTLLNSLPSSVFAVTYIKSSLHSLRAGCSVFARLQDAHSANSIPHPSILHRQILLRLSQCPGHAGCCWCLQNPACLNWTTDFLVFPANVFILTHI